MKYRRNSIQTDGFETIPLEQNQISCTPSTDIGMPSLSLSRQPSQPTSVVRFDMALPRTVPRQPPSSADFEICRLFMSGPVSLYRSMYSQAEPAPVCGQDHLECRSRRPENCPCDSRRAAHHAREYLAIHSCYGLVGLLPWRSRSLLSLCKFVIPSTQRNMIDSHCPVSGILLFHSIRWALSYARLVQETRIRRIGEPSLTE